jgi:hypothetical protein
MAGLDATLRGRLQPAAATLSVITDEIEST